MSKLIALSAIIFSSLFGPSAFGQVEALRDIEAKLAWIDTAVYLMEEIPSLSLNHKRTKILTSASPAAYVSKIKYLLGSIEGDDSLFRIALHKVDSFEQQVKNARLLPQFKIQFSELCRHARRMFGNVVYDGTVFDETPHIIYYQHRLAVRQMIQKEEDMEELKGRMNGLSLRIDQLCDSLFSSTAAIRKDIGKIRSEKERDESINDLIWNRHLRYLARDIPPAEFAKTVQGLPYKQARRALKKRLKT